MNHVIKWLLQDSFSTYVEAPWDPGYRKSVSNFTSFIKSVGSPSHLTASLISSKESKSTFLKQVATFGSNVRISWRHSTGNTDKLHSLIRLSGDSLHLTAIPSLSMKALVHNLVCMGTLSGLALREADNSISECFSLCDFKLDLCVSMRLWSALLFPAIMSSKEGEIDFHNFLYIWEDQLQVKKKSCNIYHYQISRSTFGPIH